MFRFTFRDVLWLTVVVGLSATLAFQHLQIRAKQAQIAAQSQEIAIHRQNWSQIGETLLNFAIGWQKDKPGRIVFGDDGCTITVNWDDVSETMTIPGREPKG